MKIKALSQILRKCVESQTLSSPIRFTTTVCLDYTVPTERARRVLLAGAKAAMGARGLMEEPAPVVFVGELNDRGVEYCIEYMLYPWEPLPPMAAEDIVLTSILEHLHKAGLTIAYPKGHEFQEEASVLNFDPLPLHERSRYLTQMEVFCDLAPDAIDAFVASIQPWTFQAAQTLSQPHGQGRRIYVLVEGLVQVVMTPPDHHGGAILVEQLQPGQILDEQILDTSQGHTARITAVTDGVIYEMPWDAMALVLPEPQHVLHRIDHVIAQRRAKVAHASRQVMVVDEESEAPERPAETLTTRVRSAIHRLATVRRVPRRLLIVDDAAIMRQLIQEVAEEAGLEVVGQAANGEEAVAQYQACKLDLVTMDLVMPGMDGLAALREIVTLDGQAQVLMLSAVNQQEKLAEALELGALDFIVKPFKKEHLQKTFAKLASGGQRP